MMTFNNLLKGTAAAVIAGFMALPASALTLTFDNTTTVSSNTPHTGASGTAELTFSDFTGGILIEVLVTNTTGATTFGAGATTSKLTGFGFDLLATSTWLSVGTSGSTGLIAPMFDADFQPYGTLDVAFADNSNFLGGNANNALSEGQDSSANSLTATLSDTVFGTAVALEAAMASAFAAGDLQAGMRFQQVNAGAGSDKLNYIGSTPMSPVPLPAAGWMLIAGLGGLVAAKRRKS